ncbi:MAG: hypothetical protein WCR48_01275 [Bacteroidales bacterium]
MKIVIAAIVLIGICVFGMCFNIIFRKNGHFPQTDVSSNENMRRLGIRCMKEEEDEMFGDKSGQTKNSLCDGSYSDACLSCGLYNTVNKKKK